MRTVHNGPTTQHRAMPGLARLATEGTLATVGPPFVAVAPRAELYLPNAKSLRHYPVEPGRI